MNAVVFILLACTSEFMNEQGFYKTWRCKNDNCKFINPESIIYTVHEDDSQSVFNCSLCETAHTRVEILERCKRRFRRKPRGLEGVGGYNCLSRLWKGLREFFVTEFNWTKHSWLCGYCRQRIPKRYRPDLNRYFNKLKVHHRLDEDDEEYLLTLSPAVCPFCYRKQTPRSRPVFILESISVVCFLIIVQPVLRLFLLPVHLSAIIRRSNKEKEYNTAETKTKFMTSFSLQPSQIRDIMPNGVSHQQILTFEHPIWNVVLRHRYTSFFLFFFLCILYVLFTPI